MYCLISNVDFKSHKKIILFNRLINMHSVNIWDFKCLYMVYQCDRLLRMYFCLLEINENQMKYPIRIINSLILCTEYVFYDDIIFDSRMCHHLKSDFVPTKKLCNI